jgi:hypothetical protein
MIFIPNWEISETKFVDLKRQAAVEQSPGVPRVKRMGKGDIIIPL